MIKNKFFILGIIILVGIAGYFSYQKFTIKKNDKIFALTQARRGLIQKTISGSGNVVSVETFDIKSSVSGRISYLMFKEGDKVKKGEVLIKIDTTDLEKQIRDLEFNLESQKINLEKLTQKNEQLKRGDELRKINESYLSIISEFIEKIPLVYDNLNKIYFDNDFQKENYVKNNLDYYLSYYFLDYRSQSNKIRNNLENLRNRFLTLSYNFNSLKIDPSKIDQSFIKDLYNLNSEYLNLIKFVLDKIRTIRENSLLNKQQHVYQNVIDEHLNQLNEIYATLFTYLNSFGDYINKLNSFYDNLQSLDLDIKNSQISIKQLELKIEDLKKDLKDYTIYSPVNGYIAKLNGKLNDNVNPSFVILTLQSSDKIAEIKLNEVDVAEVRIGNEAILTFDALPEIKLKGKVISIDSIGEVSQGVVSYKLKISFEDNPKVKIGMTVNADIVTQIKNSALIIPNNAIKTQGDQKYVETPDERDLLILNERVANFKNNLIKILSNQDLGSINIQLNYQPKIKIIKTGLSDGINTEILEGLKENEWIIIKSIINNQLLPNNQKQGFFQKLFPQPRQFIRSPGIR